MIKKSFAGLGLFLGLGIAAGSMRAASEGRESRESANEWGLSGVESKHALRTKLKTALDTLDYGGQALDLQPIDDLLVAGAGLDFEQSMLVDFLHITSAEDTLLNEGLILRRFKGADRSLLLARGQQIKKRLFFGSLLYRCRLLAGVVPKIFGEGVCALIVAYADDIFPVVRRFMALAPECVHQDLGTLKIVFSRERDIALGRCAGIPKPDGWSAGLGAEQEEEREQEVNRRYERMMVAVRQGVLADFVDCFERF